ALGDALASQMSDPQLVELARGLTLVGELYHVAAQQYDLVARGLARQDFEPADPFLLAQLVGAEAKQIDACRASTCPARATASWSIRDRSPQPRASARSSSTAAAPAPPSASTRMRGPKRKVRAWTVSGRWSGNSRSISGSRRRRSVGRRATRRTSSACSPWASSAARWLRRSRSPSG